MNILQKYFAKGTIKAATEAASALFRYNTAVFQYLSSGSTIYMKDNATSYINDGYYSNPDVYAAVQTIVQLALVAPMELYKVKNEKALTKYNYLLKTIPDPATTNPRDFQKHISSLHATKAEALEEVGKHKAIDVLNKPNEWQSGSEFKANMLEFRIVTGNAIAFKARATIGTPTVMGLYPIPVQNASIVSGGLMNPVSKYKLQYLGSDVEFDAAEIIHNRGSSLDYSYPGSHLWGVSPLRAAIKSLAVGNDSRAAQAYLVQNKGSDVLLALDPDGLKTPPTKEQLQDLKDEANGNINGKFNKGKISFAVGKFSSHQLGLNSNDLGIEKAINLSKEDVCKVLKISPILLASMDAATYNNYKEAKKAAISMSVIPLLTSWRDSLNKDLLPEFEPKGGYVFDNDLSVYTELQEDREKQVSYLDKAYWLTPNQKLIEMGYGEDPDPNMNKHYFPSSLMPLDELNAPKDIGNLPLNTDYE